MFGRSGKSAIRLGTVLATLSAIGTLVWSGCGSSSDRYYCDDSGCYQCDGYGCGTVAPPVATPCTGSENCPAGQVCTSDGCEQTCQQSSDCAKGTVCKSGFCVPPTTTDGGTIKECTTTGDCGPGKACIGNHCQACGGTAGPCPCATNPDCSNGQVCVAGTCTDPKNVCHYNSDCAPGKICENGECVPPCDQGGTCPAGTTCVKGGCTPAPGTGCTNDSQCPASAPHCLAGTCSSSCTADAQCPTGDYCNQGACVPDTRPKPNCTSDAQCAGGPNAETCVDGYCRYRCVVDKDCQVIDARIGFCAADKVCRTQSEAHPQCTSQAQCAAGQACVGNVCK